MSGVTWASALVTVLFAASAAYCLLRIVIGASATDRANSFVHFVMSVTMACMPWPAYTSVPSILPIIVFSAAALWYLALAMFRRDPAASDAAAHHAGSALLAGYHALMMIGMVWMAVAMMPVTSAADSMSGSMSGSMSMPGMHDHAGHGESMGPMTGSADWAVALSIGWGVLFALAAVWFLVRLIRQAVSAPTLAGRAGIEALDSLLSLVMAAGMSLSFLALMT